MPTFVFENSAASVGAVLLLDIPNIDWFKDSVLQALAEMTIRDNWRGDDEDYRTYAVNSASFMLASYKLLNFNPFPVGLIIPFGSDTAPSGYLLCDGSSYATSDYPELFAVIDYNYGGSGANFNVPNLFNRAIVGSGDDFNYMDVGGAETVTLTTAEMPSHNHTASDPTIIDPSHSHVESTAIPTAILIGAGVPAPSALPAVGSTAPAFTGITALAGAISNTGGDGAHENMPPFMALPYIIYAGR
jgi:microcystin-dependent protein